jgi:hypothetical protein
MIAGLPEFSSSRKERQTVPDDQTLTNVGVNLPVSNRCKFERGAQRRAYIWERGFDG